MGTKVEQRSQDLIVTSEVDQVFIYSLLKQSDEEQENSTNKPVAQYSAPSRIDSISCMGTCICVGLNDGQVRIGVSHHAP